MTRILDKGSLGYLSFYLDCISLCFVVFFKNVRSSSDSTRRTFAKSQLSCVNFRLLCFIIFFPSFLFTYLFAYLFYFSFFLYFPLLFLIISFSFSFPKFLSFSFSYSLLHRSCDQCVNILPFFFSFDCAIFVFTFINFISQSKLDPCYYQVSSLKYQASDQNLVT